MLKSCPECEHLVSEKAYTCPNCGYPLTNTKSEKTRKKARSHKRLPNGFGQITKISGKNLRNPYRVMVTVRKDYDGRPICKLLQPKAYFPSYNDAYVALVEYNRDPYDIETSITMDELFKMWISEHNTENPRSIKNIKYSWAYCEQIHNMTVQSIRGRHIRGLFENPYKTVDGEQISAGPATFQLLKSTVNQLCNYAVSKDLMLRNYSKDIVVQMDHEEKHHKAFTNNEIISLWNLAKTDKGGKMVIFQTYMGWRPSEMLQIRRENIDLDNMTITGGLKTKAGKKRTVPIHSAIQNIFMEFWNASSGQEWLFPSPLKKGFPLTYATYQEYFNGAMKRAQINEEHSPHDCRKHFITMGKSSKMDEYALKRIVGHAIKDITENTYTDRPVSWLREEIEKIKCPVECTNDV